MAEVQSSFSLKSIFLGSVIWIGACAAASRLISQHASDSTSTRDVEKDQESPPEAQKRREFEVQVRQVVEAYGVAWTQQSTHKIMALFTPDGEYCERPYHPRGTYVGKAEIGRYWERQITTKQKDIQFTPVESDYVYDFDKKKALVKWKASFINRLAYSNIKNETKRVEFTQVAILSFEDGVPSESLPLIKRLEEYWHSTATNQKDRTKNDDQNDEEVDAQAHRKKEEAAPNATEPSTEEDGKNAHNTKRITSSESRVAKKKNARAISAFACADVAEDPSVATVKPLATQATTNHALLVGCSRFSMTKDGKQKVQNGILEPPSLNNHNVSVDVQDSAEEGFVSINYTALSSNSDDEQERNRAMVVSLSDFWNAYSEGRDQSVSPAAALLSYFEITLLEATSSSTTEEGVSFDTLPSIGLLSVSVQQEGGTSTSSSSFVAEEKMESVNRIWHPQGEIRNNTKPLGSSSGNKNENKNLVACGLPKYNVGDCVGIGWDAITQRILLVKNGALVAALGSVVLAPECFSLCPVVAFAPGSKGKLALQTRKGQFKFRLANLIQTSPELLLTKPEVRQNITVGKSRETLLSELPSALEAKDAGKVAMIGLQILMREGEKKGAKTLRGWVKGWKEKEGADDGQKDEETGKILDDLLWCICNGKPNFKCKDSEIR